MLYPSPFFANPFFHSKIMRNKYNFKNFSGNTYGAPIKDIAPKEKEDKIDEYLPVFEIFGIKLYNDDLLILALLLFLYEEDVHDQELFLSLILLLLS